MVQQAFKWQVFWRESFAALTRKLLRTKLILSQSQNTLKEFVIHLLEIWFLPVAPWVPKGSPVQLLSRANVAKRQCTIGIWCFQHGMVCGQALGLINNKISPDVVKIISMGLIHQYPPITPLWPAWKVWPTTTFGDFFYFLTIKFLITLLHIFNGNVKWNGM